MMEDNSPANNKSFSNIVFIACKVIYGDDNWPSIIMFAMYVLLAVLDLQLLINDFSLKHLKNIPSKIISLASLFLYNLTRSVLYVVPFPFKEFFLVTFICEQLPRVIMFSAWHFLGIFFLNAFLFPSASKKYLRLFYCFLILCVLIMLALSIVLSFLQANDKEKRDNKLYDKISSIASTVYFFILSVWVTAYAIRILIIFRTPNLNAAIRRALIQFAILFISFTIIWWIRTIWAFLVALNKNYLNKKILEMGFDCVENDKQCLGYVASEQTYFFFEDLLPSLLVSLLFYITRSKDSRRKKKEKSKKQKKEKEGKYDNIEKGKANEEEKRNRKKRKGEKRRRREEEGEGEGEEEFNKRGSLNRGRNKEPPSNTLSSSPVLHHPHHSHHRTHHNHRYHQNSINDFGRENDNEDNYYSTLGVLEVEGGEKGEKGERGERGSERRIGKENNDNDRNNNPSDVSSPSLSRSPSHSRSHDPSKSHSQENSDNQDTRPLIPRQNPHSSFENEGEEGRGEGGGGSLQIGKEENALGTPQNMKLSPSPAVRSAAINAVEGREYFTEPSVSSSFPSSPGYQGMYMKKEEREGRGEEVKGYQQQSQEEEEEEEEERRESEENGRGRGGKEWEEGEDQVLETTPLLKKKDENVEKRGEKRMSERHNSHSILAHHNSDSSSSSSSSSSSCFKEDVLERVGTGGYIGDEEERIEGGG